MVDYTQQRRLLCCLDEVDVVSQVADGVFPGSALGLVSRRVLSKVLSLPSHDNNNNIRKATNHCCDAMNDQLCKTDVAPIR